MILGQKSTKDLILNHYKYINSRGSPERTQDFKTGAATYIKNCSIIMVINNNNDNNRNCYLKKRHVTCSSAKRGVNIFARL